MRIIELLESKTLKLPDSVLKELDRYASLLTQQRLMLIELMSDKEEDTILFLHKIGKAESNGKPVFPQFRDLQPITITTADGKKVLINIGVMVQRSSGRKAAFLPKSKAVVFNLSRCKTRSDFLSFGEHELIHAMDPKSYVERPSDVRSDLSNTAAKGKNVVMAYAKSPAEFDAFTSQMLNPVKRKLSELTHVQKISFKTALRSFISDMKNISIDEIKEEDVRKIFNDKRYSFLFTVWGNQAPDFIELMLIWKTKPTLYRRFLKRVSSELLSTSGEAPSAALDNKRPFIEE